MNGKGQETKSDGETVWSLMLSLRGKRGPIYVSAKRTHRFLAGKQVLSDCETNRNDRKYFGFSVGSFWKTNPPEGVF